MESKPASTRKSLDAIDRFILLASQGSSSIICADSRDSQGFLTEHHRNRYLLALGMTSGGTLRVSLQKRKPGTSRRGRRALRARKVAADEEGDSEKPTKMRVTPKKKLAKKKAAPKKAEVKTKARGKKTTRRKTAGALKKQVREKSQKRG